MVSRRFGSCSLALLSLLSLTAAKPLCFVEWSISHSYTIASEDSSYVTLNIYASNNGTTDLKAPYNISIYNPAYVDAFSWNFEVTSAVGGVILGETTDANAQWETLLARSKNVVNMGGNIETTDLNAEPEEITVGGLACTLKERREVRSRRGSQGALVSGGTPGASGTLNNNAGATSNNASTISNTGGTISNIPTTTSDNPSTFSNSSSATSSNTSGISTAGGTAGTNVGGRGATSTVGGVTKTIKGPYFTPDAGDISSSRGTPSRTGTSSGSTLPVLPRPPMPMPVPVPAPAPAPSSGGIPYEGATAPFTAPSAQPSLE